MNLKISFECNGGSEIAEIATDGSSYLNIPKNPIKEGYKFAGWYWDNNTFNKPFTGNSLKEQPIENDIIVYAKWISDINEFTMTFETNGGDRISPITQHYNKNIALQIPTRNGYTFDGWYFDDNNF